jgi:hypothetical protein
VDVLVSGVVASFHWIVPVPSRYLHLAGSLGPMLAAMIVTSVTEGQLGLTLERNAARASWEHY